MKNITETITRYVSAWDEQTPEAVAAAFKQSCAAEVTYTDKNTPLVTGIDGLTSLAMSSHKKIPGRTFCVLTAPESFDNKCYYSWGINIPGQGQFVGRDYMEYNDDNLITRIVGFVPVL